MLTGYRVWLWDCMSSAWHCINVLSTILSPPSPPFPDSELDRMFCIQQCSPLSLSFLRLVLFPCQSCKVLESRSGILLCSVVCPPGPAPASLWAPEWHTDCLLRNEGEASFSPSLPFFSLSLSPPPLLHSGLQPKKAQSLPHRFLQPPHFWAAEERKRQGAAPDQGCYSLSSLMSWTQPTLP